MPAFRPCPCLPAALLLAAGTAWGQSSPVPEETPATGAGRPRWEVGFAAGGGRVADYPGSDQTHARGLVAPIVIYRGPVLRVDGGSIRGRVFDSPDWELDLSATGAFNARDNDARRGMPGLDWLFGVGPQLLYKGWREATGGATLHLKARAIFSTDFGRIDERGATFDPELRWRLRPLADTPTTLSLSVQPSWASRALQRYFYEVTPEQALPDRPAYAARSGYLGTELGATWHRRQGEHFSWFVTARAFALHGAANEASPLLRDKTNFSVGAGLVWTPWQSAERVPD
ncbi:MAG TPA: MipA/OmpV family protein [Albitalea sp.]